MNAEAPSSTRRVTLGWLPAVAYMALIWALSSMPLSIPLGSVPFKDKGVHFVEYGTLAVLLAHAFRKTWPALGLLRVLLFAAVITSAWGYLDEVHQAFVPRRNSDAMDLLADTIGALIGSVCFGVFDRLRARRR